MPMSALMQGTQAKASLEMLLESTVGKKQDTGANRYAIT
jgi:hypothetical protein